MKQITFTPKAWKEYIAWLENKKTFKKINKLIENTARTPFEGLGKPEHLKNNLSNQWSRRINDKDRLIYEIKDKQIIITSCKYHYQDK